MLRVKFQPYGEQHHWRKKKKKKNHIQQNKTKQNEKVCTLLIHRKVVEEIDILVVIVLHIFDVEKVNRVLVQGVLQNDRIDRLTQLIVNLHGMHSELHRLLRFGRLVVEIDFAQGQVDQFLYFVHQRDSNTFELDVMKTK
jgi:hypothetical protein